MPGDGGNNLDTVTGVFSGLFQGKTGRGPWCVPWNIGSSSPFPALLGGKQHRGTPMSGAAEISEFPALFCHRPISINDCDSMRILEVGIHMIGWMDGWVDGWVGGWMDTPYGWLNNAKHTQYDEIFCWLPWCSSKYLDTTDFLALKFAEIHHAGSPWMLNTQQVLNAPSQTEKKKA